MQHKCIRHAILGMEEGKEPKDGDNSSPKKPEMASKEDILPSGAQSELLSETAAQNGSFSTQATESQNEKKAISHRNLIGYL